jgi:hypothetical protein
LTPFFAEERPGGVGQVTEGHRRKRQDHGVPGDPQGDLRSDGLRAGSRDGVNAALPQQDCSVDPILRLVENGKITEYRVTLKVTFVLMD